MPTRNPFGDALKIKFFRTTTKELEANADGVAALRFHAWNLENQVAGQPWPNTPWGSCQGFREWARQYERWQVLGIKIKVTPFISGDTDVPLVAYIMGHVDDFDLKARSVETIPEQRWCRYRFLTNWAAGGRVKSVSAYFNRSKLQTGGTMNLIQTPMTGTKQVSLGATTMDVNGQWGYFPPENELDDRIEIGVFGCDPVQPLPESAVIGCMVQVTHYVSLTNKRQFTD